MKSLSAGTVCAATGLAVLAGLGALPAFSSPAAGNAPPRQVQAAPRTPTVGRLAPPFSLTTFAGESASLTELRGQVVVINIWATWCGPCRTEMPMMHRYYQANRARGLAMFGVTTEDSVRPSHPAMRRLSGLLAYPLSNRMRGPYGANAAVPTTYVIDRGGIIRQIQVGSYSESSFREAIDPLLAAPPPPVS